MASAPPLRFDSSPPRLQGSKFELGKENNGKASSLLLGLETPNPWQNVELPYSDIAVGGPPSGHKEFSCLVLLGLSESLI